MDQIVIAIIAGVIGFFIYQAVLPLKAKLEKNQRDNLGKEKTTLGTIKSEKQLAFELIQLDLNKFEPKEIEYSKCETSGGNYWDCVEVMIVFKNIPYAQQTDFKQQAEKFCSENKWAQRSKIMVDCEKDNGIILVQYK